MTARENSMKVFFVVLMMLGGQVFAHEGHDGPVAVQAPKGGVIKATDDAYFEVLSKGKDLRIYAYDKDLKPADPAKFQVTAQAQPPRGKKAEKVTLTAKDGYYQADYDAKGVHRYTLILTVKDGHEDHGHTLNFTVEPRKQVP